MAVAAVPQRPDGRALPGNQVVVEPVEARARADLVDGDHGHHRRRRVGGRVQRRKRGTQTRTAQLEQLDRVGQVTQPVHPESPEAEVVGQPTGRHVDHRSRGDHLPAVGGGADPGALVDHAADVVVVARLGLTDEHAGPHGEALVGSTLERGRGVHGLRGEREGGEVAVTLAACLDQGAVVRVDDRGDVGVEGAHGRLHLVGRAVPALGARLDVGHEEGDHPGRQGAHRPSDV